MGFRNVKEKERDLASECMQPLSCFILGYLEAENLAPAGRADMVFSLRRNLTLLSAQTRIIFCALIANGEISSFPSSKISTQL